jgi:hypothetical protein
VAIRDYRRLPPFFRSADHRPLLPLRRDVFGAPLAMEDLLAFFMESVFLGLWIFG